MIYKLNKTFYDDFLNPLPNDLSIKLEGQNIISRRGLTPLVMFTGTMCSKDFQNFLTESVLPVIRKKMPFNHTFNMDNYPKPFYQTIHDFEQSKSF